MEMSVWEEMGLASLRDELLTDRAHPPTKSTKNRFSHFHSICPYSGVLLGLSCPTGLHTDTVSIPFICDSFEVQKSQRHQFPCIVRISNGSLGFEIPIKGLRMTRY